MHDNGADLNLTVNEKILIHLKDFSSYREKKDVPKAVTQKGIAASIGILPSHTPRALKRLISDGFILERDGYAEGTARKSKAYFLTDDGMQRTRMLAETVCSIPVEMRHEGSIHKIPLCDVNMHLRNKMTLLALYNHYSRYKSFDIDRIESGQKIVEFTSGAPRIFSFVARERDFELLKAALDDSRVVVIFGCKGVGKTVLAGKYMESVRGKRSIFWYQLHASDTLPEILDSIAEFLELMGIKSLTEYLKKEKTTLAESLVITLNTLSGSDSILIFDNYNEVHDETVVDFFSLLVSMIRDIDGVRVLLTARENIPFYNWFYTRKEIERRVVSEIHLKGLDKENGKRILSVKDIDEDAYKQIHQLTKGTPQLLEYVRNDDTQALKSTGQFTAQEIRLMLGLKRVLKR